MHCVKIKDLPIAKYDFGKILHMLNILTGEDYMDKKSYIENLTKITFDN